MMLLRGLSKITSIYVPVQFNFIQSIQTQSARYALDKKLLTDFKRKTGYSFAKCNEALKKHNNNIEEAEAWLHDQAEKEGWTKSEKLKSRSTSQGLVSVTTKDNFAALVEVSCETDFVARNELFQELVAVASQSTLEFRKNVILQSQKISSNTTSEITHLRETLLAHEISNLLTEDSKTTLQDYLVSIIGKVGENIKFKRAIAIATPSSNVIGSASHGNSAGSLNGCSFGAYASCIVLKPSKQNSDLETKNELVKLANGLSHHVIGMNPKSITDVDGIPKEETLIHQEYLLNDKFTVQELLDKNNCKLVDFIRYGINE